jgi:hypothetical protein
MRRRTEPIPKKKTKEELISEVIGIFQPHSPTPLTQEDGREIYENLTGFFKTLLRVQRQRELALGGAK